MESALESAVKRFVDRHPKSRALHEKALHSLPGGNTRTLLYTAPFPIYMRKGEGHKLYDEDGYEYFDLVSELTAGLYGHSHPRLQEALKEAIYDIGVSLGATNSLEQRYASLLCQRFNLERIRFTNSGTEANLHCIGAARRFTGRRKVVVFRGAYHGSVLGFAMGSAPNNVDRADWLVVQYNDINSLENTFKEHQDIAAIIMEGIQGSAGFIRASPEFLRKAQELSKKKADFKLQAGSVFILDEVMTSRLAVGGLKSLLDVRPDMVTLGKYLGGGMPIGAFGGREDIMDVYNPSASNSLVHSGTFQNNTLMLHAGYIGLSEVYTPEATKDLNDFGDQLRRRLQKVLEGTKFCVTGLGSLMCIHATKTGLVAEHIKCKDDVASVEAMDLKKLFWLEMLDAGFWIHMRGSIALNLAMPSEAIDSFVSAVEKFCDKHRKLITP